MAKPSALASGRRDVESHLRTCVSCREELRDRLGSEVVGESLPEPGDRHWETFWKAAEGKVMSMPTIGMVTTTRNGKSTHGPTAVAAILFPDEPNIIKSSAAAAAAAASPATAVEGPSRGSILAIVAITALAAFGAGWAGKAFLAAQAVAESQAREARARETATIAEARSVAAQAPAPVADPMAVPVAPAGDAALAVAPTDSADSAAVAGAPTEGTTAGTSDSRRKSRAKSSDKEPGASASADTEDGAPAAAPTEGKPAPAAGAPAAGGKSDDLESLLEGAVTQKEAGGTPAKEEEPAKDTSGDLDLSTGLAKKQIQSVMARVQPKVRACAAEHEVEGPGNVVDVRFTVAPSGRVSAAKLAGKYKGTPVGNCVLEAVKELTFPSFVGEPQSVSYPLPLI